ncbi:MAG TPA: hypothetical protein VMA72_18220 [Streptosporangiaceae bacterium]|nr:hypothetical protein [Streptosporangiaceae bacterium]
MADRSSELEAKHGMALHHITGHVYALHYKVRQVVKPVSTDYAGPSTRTDGIP